MIAGMFLTPGMKLIGKGMKPRRILIIRKRGFSPGNGVITSFPNVSDRPKKSKCTFFSVIVALVVVVFGCGRVDWHFEGKPVRKKFG
ncbi:Hypothetical predicted protein [Octopus vulgaris]|uniref:Uncharacterized protein n=1 Tax=Octopus vulgaris TaxID=6645 RepID=A0AA36FJT8_OCTVU|nr:Hypothetical predicted protein [Octopus vulgaris]